MVQAMDGVGWEARNVPLTSTCTSHRQCGLGRLPRKLDSGKGCPAEVVPGVWPHV